MTEDGQLIADYTNTLIFRGRTSYDYVKKKTLLGGTESPLLGEIIPYSFAGNYHWIQKIAPFEMLKGFQIDTFSHFNHAVLDERNGDIRMNIIVDDENGVSPQYVIGRQDILRIKKYNKTYDLRVLKSMGQTDE